jgi:hypothetical protein
LLSCSSKKKSFACKAHELYAESPIFSLAYEYAKMAGDKIYILSSKYGLVNSNDILEPYNEYLGDKTEKEQLAWSNKVIEKLMNLTDAKNDTYEILAGKLYYKNIIKCLSKFSLPLQHKSIGEWSTEIQRLIDRAKYPGTANVSAMELHQYFNSLPRYNYSQIDKIPFSNGIYVMFEQNEFIYDVDRIVRIGTHKSESRLKNRLKDHFLTEDKNGSIFRKNIGRALLNSRSDDYIKIWELDTRNNDVYAANKQFVNINKERGLEQEISMYIRENITFTCINVNSQQDRLRFEEGLIGSLNQNTIFKPSSLWLGLSSPVSDIRNSGLWLRQGLDAPPITLQEYDLMKQYQNSDCNAKSINIHQDWHKITGITDKLQEKKSAKDRWNKGNKAVYHQLSGEP